MSKIVRKQIRELTIVNENKITRKNREIVNEYCEKVFNFGYDKRAVKKIDPLSTYLRNGNYNLAFNYMFRTGESIPSTVIGNVLNELLGYRISF